MQDSKHYVKILLKVLDTEKNKIRWVHFCYSERDVYNKFIANHLEDKESFNAVLARWCKEDFNVEINMSSVQDVALLKQVVQDFYKRAHPDIYVDNPWHQDRQGWLRVWVTRKMKEDLGIYGKLS